MKKKGFTLVELIAVVALVGIIITLVTPEILKIFNNSADKVTLLTAEKLVNATEVYVRDYQLQYGKVLSDTTISIIDKSIPNNPLTVSGNLPKSGAIYINDESVIALAIYDRGICAFKDYDWQEAQLFDVEESECNYESLMMMTDIYAPIIALEINDIDDIKLSSTITFYDRGSSGLDEFNKYEYYLSTSKVNLVDGVWTPYTNGTSFTVDRTISSSFYLWVYPIKDKAGNISGNNSDTTKPYVINRYIFDSDNPILTVNPSSETFDTSGNITITVSDASNNLSDSNIYKYCLSTSNTLRENCQWTDYENDKSFTVNGLNQIKYLWIWPVQDRAGNILEGHNNVNTPFVAGTYEFITNYNITYTLNSGSVSSTNPTTYNYKTNSFTLTNPTKANYIFAGWTGSNGTTKQTTVTVPKGSTGDKSYTANWTPATYTITYNLNGGSVSSANPTTYNYETAAFTLKNPTRAGYTFAGWTGSNGTTKQTTVTVSKNSTGNKTYTANWTPITYTITYNCNGGSGSTAASSHKYGTAKALSSNGCYRLTAGTSGIVYHLAGWSKSSSATSPTYTNAQSVSNVTTSSAVTLYAVWKNLFSYSGSYTIINDGSTNWRVKFLTSGTLTVNYPATIDVFLVGGGSSNGGSGYTATYKSINLSATKYSIVVGAGGAAGGSNGTASTAFGYTAKAGNGGNGGSGAGSNGYVESGGNGGSNGASAAGGTGQGTTTREFGESSGTLYAGGGGGGTGWCWGTCPATGCNIGNECYVGGFNGGNGGAGGGGYGQSSTRACSNGTANTGGGAGLGIRGAASCSGGSGIVVIRNAR